MDGKRRELPTRRFGLLSHILSNFSASSPKLLLTVQTIIAQRLAWPATTHILHRHIPFHAAKPEMFPKVDLVPSGTANNRS